MSIFSKQTEFLPGDYVAFSYENITDQHGQIAGLNKGATERQRRNYFSIRLSDPTKGHRDDSKTFPGDTGFWNVPQDSLILIDGSKQPEDIP